MTVNNIVNMSILKGLDIIALTDHNSARNCPAFLEAAKRAGIKALAGMEISTVEEVHAVCLFPDLERAMAFDGFVYESLPNIKNKVEIFGNQLILNAEDEIIGQLDKLLVNASGISFYDLNDLMKEYGGLYFPAHIDRDSFSLLANLGFVPPDCIMSSVEIKDMSKYDNILLTNPIIEGLPIMRNSDAHYLWDISEAANKLDEKIYNIIAGWL